MTHLDAPRSSSRSSYRQPPYWSSTTLQGNLAAARIEPTTSLINDATWFKSPVKSTTGTSLRGRRLQVRIPAAEVPWSKTVSRAADKQSVSQTDRKMKVALRSALIPLDMHKTASRRCRRTTRRHRLMHRSRLNQLTIRIMNGDSCWIHTDEANRATEDRSVHQEAAER
ncbi:hypothetical protein PAMP_002541 [Pampus punctatissimus]